MNCKTILLVLLLTTALQPVLATPFEIVTAKSKVSIVYTKSSNKLDSIIAYLLANDIKLVTGYLPKVYTDLSKAKGNVIIINSHQQQGKWESYSLKVIKRGAAKALLITGSDARGAAYGVFELSERIGVSPWYWWADVMPETKRELVIDITPVNSEPPSVRYRGIFINDEDWGLQPWAAKTFEPNVGNIGPKTYAKVFELLLRLKANMIWPAMHPGTTPFFNVPGNKEMAAAYNIIIGSSHAEPMLRNNVGEWKEDAMGRFNYLTNRQQVFNYWQQRVKESSKVQAIYSLGMRGVHDSGMEGIKNSKDAVPLLEQIFTDQRGLLAKYINKDVSKVPQAFTAYKEVLDIYDNGLKVPEDVTIVWPDDNYGYIQRLSDEAEKKRPGGSGVYYHISYWGRPHDYLWLSTTHPGLIREEMMKAWKMNSDKLWVVNVGDIKPMEYQTQLFLDMAYNAMPFNDSKYTKQHLNNWISNIFGTEKGDSITALLWKHYQLAFERRPEFMGWSQTEPTTQVSATAYNRFYYGDEAQRRIDSYDSLEKAVKQMRAGIEPRNADAFYELVYYPVVCASLMNKKFLYRDKGDSAASKRAYAEIENETANYNSIAGGKWKNMMSMKPRNLPVFQEPAVTGSDEKKVIAEGRSDTLPTFDDQNNQKYFIDAGDWPAIVSADWIRLSKVNDRTWVEVDWSKFPAGRQHGGYIVFNGKDTIHVNARTLDVAQYTGFVENNGIVAMRAIHYSESVFSHAAQWQMLDDLEMLQSPLALANDSPYVAYEFYTFSAATPVVNVYSLPTHTLNRSFSVRYAVGIDEGPLSVVDIRTVGRSEEWKQNVLRNSAISRISFQKIGPGKHTLKIYCIDPGVAIGNIVIDLGGLKSHYSMIPETTNK